MVIFMYTATHFHCFVYLHLLSHLLSCHTVEWYGEVSDIWWRISEIGLDKIGIHGIEAMVRQQILIDVWSRKQQRLVRVVSIAQVLHGSIWKMFVSSNTYASKLSNYIKNIHQRLKIGSTLPETTGAIYWVGAPFLVKKFVNNIVWLFPNRLQNVLHVLGSSYRSELLSKVDQRTFQYISQGEQWIQQMRAYGSGLSNTMSLIDSDTDDDYEYTTDTTDNTEIR